MFWHTLFGLLLHFTSEICESLKITSCGLNTIIGVSYCIKKQKTIYLYWRLGKFHAHGNFAGNMDWNLMCRGISGHNNRLSKFWKIKGMMKHCRLKMSVSRPELIRTSSTQYNRDLKFPLICIKNIKSTWNTWSIFLIRIKN